MHSSNDWEDWIGKFEDFNDYFLKCWENAISSNIKPSTENKVYMFIVYFTIIA